MMCSKFLAQIQNVGAITFDIDGFNRMNNDGPNRCYRWLRVAVDRALDTWRAEQHRAVYSASLWLKRRSRR
eukprot:7554671-Heterocapsa_arctica.AAC.1